MFTESVSYSAAFLAGLLSFLSPCILPLIPAYFTFISGYSLEELIEGRDAAIRRKVIISTIAYVCGFSLVFILLGASASFIGSLVYKYNHILRIIGGIFIILLGMHLIGLFRFNRLDVEKRIHLKTRPVHFMGTFLVGMAFAAGWSPCIGPLLGSILIIAGNQETVLEGTALLAVYAAGLAIPFMVLSVFIQFLLNFVKNARYVLKYVNPAAGILLIIVGLMLITDKFYLFMITG